MANTTLDHNTNTDTTDKKRPSPATTNTTSSRGGGVKSGGGGLEIQVLEGIKVSFTPEILGGGGGGGGGHVEYSMCVRRIHQHHDVDGDEKDKDKEKEKGKGKEEKDVWAHKGGEWSVMRRYSDFLFLYSVLVAGCIAPGRIVPGIPGKVCVCVIF